ncbi:MAG: diguanylate cyclase [Nitriliruptoraceae bacterium]
MDLNATGDASPDRPLPLDAWEAAGVEPSVAGAALDLAEHMIVITDPDGVIVYVNPAFTATTGYPREEAIGGTPRLLRSGMQGDGFYQQLWETITRGEPWSGELVNRRRSGELYTDRMTITPLKDAEGAIRYFVAVKRDVSSHLAELTAGNPTGIAHLDLGGHLIYANDRLAELLERPQQELLGRSWWEAMADDVSELEQRSSELREPRSTALVPSEHPRGTTTVHTRGGRTLRVNLAPLDVGGQGRAGVVGAFEDITTEAAAVRELAKREAYSRSILDSLDSPTAVIDDTGVITAVNQAWHDAGHLGGADPGRVGVGTDYRAVCRRSAAAGSEDAEQTLALIDRVLSERREAGSLEYHMPEPQPRWWELKVTPLAWEDGGAVLAHTDVTARHELEQVLRREATTDPLTGLLNRAGLHERYAAMAARAARHGRQLSVLYLDLDGFKRINDELGHEAGDAVLRECARRLTAGCRGSDLVARVGGDEFVVVADEVDVDGTRSLVVRLEAELAAPLDLDHLAQGQPSPQLAASIGWARIDAATDLEHGLAAADERMYMVKGRRGRSS